MEVDTPREATLRRRSLRVQIAGPLVWGLSAGVRSDKTVTSERRQTKNSTKRYGARRSRDAKSPGLIKTRIKKKDNSTNTMRMQCRGVRSAGDTAGVHFAEVLFSAPSSAWERWMTNMIAEVETKTTQQGGPVRADRPVRSLRRFQRPAPHTDPSCSQDQFAPPHPRAEDGGGRLRNPHVCQSGLCQDRDTLATFRFLPPGGVQETGAVMCNTYILHAYATCMRACRAQ